MSHAKLSPSSAHRWTRCPGSVALSAGLQNTSSEHAAEGTLAHALAAHLLDPTQPAPEQDTGHLVEDVMQYVDYVTDLVSTLPNATLLVEQALPIDHITGETGARGTADAVVVADDLLVIVDLKFGRGVRVDALENEQLAMYASGALAELDDLFGPFERVRMVIHQPRLGHVSEWEIPTEELHIFAGDISDASLLTADLDAPRTPGEKQCRWCNAKAHCPELAQHNTNIVMGDFADLTTVIEGDLLEPRKIDVLDLSHLGYLLAQLDGIEAWCKALRDRAMAEADSGNAIPGWKLVAGRRGSRAWADPEQAEATLKRMGLRVGQMYDMKLISPTSAEKLHKAGEIGPKQWPALEKMSVQPAGKPCLVPESDRRPAISPTVSVDDFDDCTTPECTTPETVEGN